MSQRWFFKGPPTPYRHGVAGLCSHPGGDTALKAYVSVSTRKNVIIVLYRLNFGPHEKGSSREGYAVGSEEPRTWGFQVPTGGGLYVFGTSSPIQSF